MPDGASVAPHGSAKYTIPSHETTRAARPIRTTTGTCRPASAIVPSLELLSLLS
jgi:hypothetical protein